MFGYLKITAAVPGVFPGDVSRNSREIIKIINGNSDSNIILFPELSLTGCSAGDLFLQNNFLDNVKKEIVIILEKTSECKAFAVFGAPVMIDGSVYNAAVGICSGRILGITLKDFRSSDRMSNEARWFSDGALCAVPVLNSASLGIKEDYDIPVGNSVIYDFCGVKTACVIGEDFDCPVPLSGQLCSLGATVIMNLSAALSLSTSEKERLCAVKRISSSCRCIYVYSSSGYGESTGHGVYTGNAAVCENGRVLCNNFGMLTESDLLECVADYELVSYKRMRKRAVFSVTGGKTVSVETGKQFSNCLRDRESEKLPFNPGKDDFDNDCLKIFNTQATALKRRLEVTGCRPVLGVSGGLDSTLALLVCIKAAELMGKSADSVIGITLPCFGTTERTHSNASALIETLGATWLEIDIKDACTRHCEAIGHPVDLFDVTYENIQARERTQVLMDYACSVGGLVIGTGDLSELALGWCTYNGDHMSMYGVNGDVPKTLIREIIGAVIRAEIFPGAENILRDIADTPISPELLPPDKNGEIQQQTEDIIGPYILHDFFLYHMLSDGYGPEKIFNLAVNTFAGEYDRKTIRKWLKTFYKRFFTSQFKRSCQPEGVNVLKDSLSFAGDWVMPGDVCFELWMKETEDLV